RTPRPGTAAPPLRARPHIDALGSDRVFQRTRSQNGLSTILTRTILNARCLYAKAHGNGGGDCDGCGSTPEREGAGDVIGLGGAAGTEGVVIGLGEGQAKGAGGGGHGPAGVGAGGV